ncbi:MAG: hypothetical protein A2787_04420 [Omnitrophica WOR_2 bacterium RIFCSPHIGHO2_01_FULL_48_9]|nr:MAG: hypothetical protein A3D10_05550 [Omnitrophica WOR_2 bacterium RIFCSPHIGHO2_02_FULL_48_11]OGX33166.1 MAG: hypothetical protein A2787_04420 [Omnitrophica WOR_2 bacterium RIFCSPHIGHO2_01_FULL_48_9]
MKKNAALQNRFLGFAFCILFILGMGGCATVPKGTSGITNLKDLCDRNGVEFDWDSVSQVVTLKGFNLRAKVLVGSDIVMVGKDKVTLSSRVKRVRSSIIVPPDFEEKILNRFKTGADFAIKKFKKIVVDAGHGGKDPGATGKSGMKEKNVVLDIARRLAKNLSQSGIEVVMTRDDDEFLTLEKRTEIAARSNADLFVSVHANSNPSRSIDGLEVYYMGQFLKKDKKEEQRLKNQGILYSHLEMEQGSADLEKILSDMMHTYKQAESRSLASHVASDTAKSSGAMTRGHKEARFFVLRNTLIPAILIETGYLTNAREEKLLATDDYRQKIADGVAESLCNYVK